MEKLEQLLGGLLLYALIFLMIAIPLTFTAAVWKRTDLSLGSKIMWMLFFVFAPLISILCYLLFGYRQSNGR